MTLEHLVEDHCGEEELHRVVHRHQTKVGVGRIAADHRRAPTVVLEAWGHRVVVAVHGDVQDDGHVACGETSPYRIEVGVREGTGFRVGFIGVDHDGEAAIGERLVEELACDLRAKGQRDIPPCEQPMVVGTESTHRPVVDAGPDLKGLRISLMGDLVKREGTENELSLEPEHVEGVGSIGRVEGAEAGPRTPRDVEHACLELRHHLPVGVAPRKVLAALGDRLKRYRELVLLVHRAKERTFVVRGDGSEEIIEFEEVAVDIDDPSVPGIRHEFPRCSVAWPSIPI